MTYDWPSASSIHPMRCVGKAVTGVRCKRRRWITTHEAPDGWRCVAHKAIDSNPQPSDQFTDEDRAKYPATIAFVEAWEKLAPGHALSQVSQLGYPRPICVKCGSDWPCADVAEAMEAVTVA